MCVCAYPPPLPYLCACACRLPDKGFLTARVRVYVCAFRDRRRGRHEALIYSPSHTHNPHTLHLPISLRHCTFVSNSTSEASRKISLLAEVISRTSEVCFPRNGISYSGPSRQWMQTCYLSCCFCWLQETMETFFVLRVSMYLHIIISIDANYLVLARHVLACQGILWPDSLHMLILFKRY